jgi:hypothetical protein
MWNGGIGHHDDIRAARQFGVAQAAVGGERIENDGAGRIEKERRHGNFRAAAESRSQRRDRQHFSAQQPVLIRPGQTDHLQARLLDLLEHFGRGGFLSIAPQPMLLDKFLAHLGLQWFWSLLNLAGVLTKK